MTLAARSFVTRGFDPLAPSSVPRRTARADRLPTAALEAMALAHVDGNNTIEAIAAKLAISQLECAVLMARLVELGCIAFGDAIDDGVEGRATTPSGVVRAARPPREHRPTMAGRRRRRT